MKDFEKFQARIQSAYYIKNKALDPYKFQSKEQAYKMLKRYIQQHKDPSDIIIYDDINYKVIINTVNKELPLDRYVYIDRHNVNLDDLNKNL